MVKIVVTLSLCFMMVAVSDVYAGALDAHYSSCRLQCGADVDIRDDLNEIKWNLHKLGSKLKVDRKRRDCADIKKENRLVRSGVYTIHLDQGDSFSGYCDFTDDREEWLVIQNRFDGSEEFRRNFTEYVTGFGSVFGEFWLGLNKMHRLTSSGRWHLRVDVMDFSGRSAYAKYDKFEVGAESAFVLSLGNYSGNAGDSIGHCSGAGFSTPDFKQGATWMYNGAWWFRDPVRSNLNAFDYYEVRPNAKKMYSSGALSWHSFRHFNALKKVSMRIRRVL